MASRGFAFVEFEDSDSVDKTLLQQFHPLDGVLLEVKRSYIRNPKPRPPQQRRMGPPAPPKFDKGPRSRVPACALAITPFPRHVEIKPKPDPGIPLDRCESATSGSFASNNQALKPEPGFVKTEND